MTPLLKIYTEYCDKYIDDIRLKEKLYTNKPVYAWTMWGYFQPAISLFTIPPEMTDYLIGTADNPNLIAPKFISKLYTVEEDKTADFVVELGEEYKGYEIINCQAKTIIEETGEVVFIPLKTEYDSTTGNVTVKVRSGFTVKANTVLDFDLYSDGYFNSNLSMSTMSVLGFCFAVQWWEQFQNNFLSNVSKPEDKSFSEQNRANKENADTNRAELLRRDLERAMLRFEQNIAYKEIVGKRFNI